VCNLRSSNAVTPENSLIYRPEITEFWTAHQLGMLSLRENTASLCLRLVDYAPRLENALGSVNITTILNLDTRERDRERDEWPASRFGRITPVERALSPIGQETG
jgi:hypothetical protein